MEKQSPQCGAAKPRTIDNFIKALPKDVKFYVLHSSIIGWNPERYKTLAEATKQMNWWEGNRPERIFKIEVEYED